MYPATISFKIDGEIKSFTDKQKLTEFSTTKPALQQMLKGLIQSRNTREGKRSTKSTPSNSFHTSVLKHQNSCQITFKLIYAIKILEIFECLVKKLT